jgi:hypothetical protein
MKQTAVEWLIENSHIIPKNELNKRELIKQAKEMEKEQIILHSVELCKLLLSNPIEKSGKQPNELIESYLNKTFKSE